MLDALVILLLMDSLASVLLKKRIDLKGLEDVVV